MTRCINCVNTDCDAFAELLRIATTRHPEPCALCEGETTELDRPTAAADPWVCSDCLRATSVAWVPVEPKKRTTNFAALVPAAAREGRTA